MTAESAAANSVQLPFSDFVEHLASAPTTLVARMAAAMRYFFM
jgi:hypothetical protein